eukprot:COSAG01_NODE_64034_length_278_cov_0.569832_1_plen_44_part_10
MFSVAAGNAGCAIERAQHSCCTTKLYYPVAMYVHSLDFTLPLVV